jgi:glucose-1-phosphate thymidylyltransferase
MNNFKGIILSGGTGSRFFPVTKSISKQLLAIYNKPMIYYSLSILMLMGIKDILIITRPDEKKLYQKLLGNGKNFGTKFKYISQPKPGGIAESFLLGKKFIGKKNIALILGDNFFYGKNLEKILKKTIQENQSGASIFISESKKPQDFGVVEINKKNKILSIVEKPKKPKSNYIVTGLYLYDNSVVDFTKILKYSKRGELEITDLNNKYLKYKKLHGVKLDSKIKWMDNGNSDALLETSNFVKRIENKEKKLLLSPELIAFKNKWINKYQLKKNLKRLKNSDYGKSLMKLI